MDYVPKKETKVNQPFDTVSIRNLIFHRVTLYLYTLNIYYWKKKNSWK